MIKHLIAGLAAAILAPKKTTLRHGPIASGAFTITKIELAIAGR